MVYVVVSSPPANEETGAMRTEIESRLGVGRVVALCKKSIYILPYCTKISSFTSVTKVGEIGMSNRFIKCRYGQQLKLHSLVELQQQTQVCT
jgi:hypothetical protein